jgi:GTP pyrophosphokinase
VTKLTLLLRNIKTTINWLDYVTTSEQNENKNVLNENTKKIGEEGKELDSKIKTFKITMSEQVVNELVNFFKLKTSLDLFYRVGIGAIENQQGLRSTKAIVSLIFQNKMKRSPSTADEDIHKPTNDQ